MCSKGCWAWLRQHPPPVGPRGLCMHTDQLSPRPEHMSIWCGLLSHAWTHLTEFHLVQIPNTTTLHTLCGCWPVDIAESPLRILRLGLQGLSFSQSHTNSGDPLTTLLTCLLSLKSTPLEGGTPHRGQVDPVPCGVSITVPGGAPSLLSSSR